MDKHNQPRTIKYAMISTEVRRDLDSPLALFQQLDIVHFYRNAPWNDMMADDYGPRLVKYDNPRDLIKGLERTAPDLIQCLEPYAVVNLPYLMMLTWYVQRSSVPLITVTLENLSLSQKYTPIGSIVMAPWIRSILKRSLATFYVNDGGRQNLLRLGANPRTMRFAMYGCWGVDTHEFSPTGHKVDLAKQPNEIVILYVGRIVEAKGIFDVLDAFSHIQSRTTQPTRLVVIGDGTARPEFNEANSAAWVVYSCGCRRDNQESRSRKLHERC